MSVTILFVDDEPDLEALVQQKFRRQIRDGAVLESVRTGGSGPVDCSPLDAFYIVTRNNAQVSAGGLPICTESGAVRPQVCPPAGRRPI